MHVDAPWSKALAVGLVFISLAATPAPAGAAAQDEGAASLLSADRRPTYGGLRVVDFRNSP